MGEQAALRRGWHGLRAGGACPPSCTPADCRLHRSVHARLGTSARPVPQQPIPASAACRRTVGRAHTEMHAPGRAAPACAQCGSLSGSAVQDTRTPAPCRPHRDGPWRQPGAPQPGTRLGGLGPEKSLLRARETEMYTAVRTARLRTGSWLFGRASRQTPSVVTPCHSPCAFQPILPPSC